MPMFQLSLSDATKIETFLFPKIAKRRDFLTQKTRRSAISRPIFASVHGPACFTNRDVCMKVTNRVKCLKPGVHKRKWDAEIAERRVFWVKKSRRSAEFGNINFSIFGRAAQRKRE